MDLNVYARGNAVGTCSVSDQGLYWNVHCVCKRYAPYPVRLLGAGFNLGVAEIQGESLVFRRKLSKSSVPGFPSSDGCVLVPVYPARMDVCGYCLEADVEKTSCGTRIFIPFVNNGTNPCMPLMCFWHIKDCFWILNLDEKGLPCFDL